ncbi:MAG: hypothetical protein OQL06_04040 [Gammaproteobacteria bacterium]|nr:hypothetical protein [Gammaproteobacteria bacterium]
MLAGNSAHAIEFDGFLTAGFSIHDQDNVTYLDGITDDVSFDNDSKFGLQVTADVSENMQVVSQILAAGADDNYDLDVEWAYLDYALSESVSLRGGKVKEPVFLISDYFEVGYAYPWIRPPQEVYRNNPVNTINGMEMLFQTNVRGYNLTFQPYLGSNTDVVPGQPGLTFNAENFYGAAIQISNPAFTFQISYLDTDVNVNGTMLVADPAGAPAPYLSTMPLSSMGTATLVSAGFSLDINNFVLYSEYVTRDIEPDAATDPARMDTLFPDQDAFYVTLGYRMGKYLPHITFADSEAEPVTGGDPGVNQDSVTLGLRYELNDSAALKMEYQTVNVDAVPAGNTGFFSGALPTGEDSGSIISMSIDVIF